MVLGQARRLLTVSARDRHVKVIDAALPVNVVFPIDA